MTHKLLRNLKNLDCYSALDLEKRIIADNPSEYFLDGEHPQTVFDCDENEITERITHHRHWVNEDDYYTICIKEYYTDSGSDDYLYAIQVY